MKNKIFKNTDENKFAREVLPEGLGSGLFLVKGSIKLDDTHLSSFDETFLVIRSVGGSADSYDHSLVICSQGAFFDDVKVWSEDQITARKPIILTPETTEVDEETYQKLLSDDVDVIFKTDDGNYCVRTYNEAEGVYCFTGLSAEGDRLEDIYLYGYRVSINDTVPHKVVIDEFFANEMYTIIKENGFINKPILSPVLQEIDLTGTDSERKAKLDQFEADWKALTGTRDLSGSRFIGHYLTNDGSMITGVFSYDIAAANYSALTPDEDDKPYVISLELDGSIYIAPLFSHLEPVPLTDTTSTNKTQLDLFLSKVPNAQVMHCTYKDVYAGTLHKINGSWYGVLVGESNTLAGQLSIKLQADGTIVEGTA